MHNLTFPKWLLLALIAFGPGLAAAQFQFFEQMFQGHGHGHGQQPRQNVPSDSAGYREHYDNAYCDRYLCPQTLACVHFPHHCPCPWPSMQDKVELGQGSMLCASKGGSEAGETARKIELARKGLL